ncbi:hypothetical protein KC945_00860 [Candidatus Saccharibacteria bacterium]|jgi:Na+/H+ antiporter NhaA|nr:hypothetical protein [Candidatus Saccharibacteria bacterium]
MQKTATKVFIAASIAFGIVGILFVLSLPLKDDNNMSDLSHILQKLLFICVFIILPSFALSVAGKYLKK